MYSFANRIHDLLKMLESADADKSIKDLIDRMLKDEDEILAVFTVMTYLVALEPEIGNALLKEAAKFKRHFHEMARSN